ncbi:MAG: hypothetical protein SGILL_007158 [Bacillariaceae sp.]
MPLSPTIDTTVSKAECTAVSSSQPSQEKKVSFAPTAWVLEVLHVKDYTPEEYQATWYTSAESKQMRKDRRETVKYMETLNKDWDFVGDQQEDFTNDASECFRGLEGKTKKVQKRRHMDQTAAQWAVLDEQDEQWVRKVIEPDAIASLYAMHTCNGMERARLRGQRDAMIAAAIEATNEEPVQEDASRIRRIIALAA